MTDNRDVGPPRVAGFERDDAKFTVVGFCHACTRRLELMTCRAFPDGIPLRVMTGDIDHRYPLPGDHGLHFELATEDNSPPRDDADDVAVLCRALLEEPLLHASLGSKELFHSNILAWLCETHPHEAAEILRPWLVELDHSEPERVEREYRHVDLLVHLSGYAPLLIENKTFSLPDEDQLSRYATEVAPQLGPDTTLVLLSLSDPGWVNDEFRVGDKVWRWVSYGQLAQRIRQHFWDQKDFQLEIFAHEARLMDLLHRLVQRTSLQSEDEPYDLPEADLAELDVAHLRDTVGKMRAHQLLAEIRHQYAGEGLKPTSMRVNFTRGLPLVEAFWMGPNGDGVGWQLQGKQWRLAMILGSMRGRGPAASSIRADYASTQTEWFDFTQFRATFGLPDAGEATPVGPFRKYDPDFVYRYLKVPADVTFEQLVELALAYGRMAQDFTFAPVTT